MREFTSSRVRNIPPSGIRKFFDIASTMEDVISLGVGEPDFTTPEPFLQAGVQALLNGATHYTSNMGLIELRRAISQNMAQLYGVHYAPEDEVLLTVGSSEALYLAAAAFIDPGDEVIIPEPAYVAYGPEVILAGGTPVYVPTYVEEAFQVRPEDIEAAITPRTKALLLGYPSNPTGAVLTRERALAIAEVAKKHDLLVFSDEIYDRLVYGMEHVCIASLPGMFERTITLGGFSKGYAMTGWRIGYILAPAPLLAAMHKVHQYTIMSAPTAAQHAAVAAMACGERYVQQMREEYDRRRRLIVDGLNELGLTTFEPRGAFFVFPSVTVTGMDDFSFSEKLLQEERVAVVPGSAFGESGRGYIRCCYATAYNEIEEALHRIHRFMQRHG